MGYAAFRFSKVFRFDLKSPSMSRDCPSTLTALLRTGSSLINIHIVTPHRGERSFLPLSAILFIVADRTFASPFGVHSPKSLRLLSLAPCHPVGLPSQSERIYSRQCYLPALAELCKYRHLLTLQEDWHG